MERELNWVIVGCGVIANELATAMEKHGRHLYGVANRTYEKAVAFAAKYQIPTVYEQIEDAFLDDQVDVIYLSTPHNTHIQYLRKALASGKHVLCEKSITLNSQELEEAETLAKEHRRVLGEAMTLYHMPLYQKLAEMLGSGTLGQVNVITLNFGSFKEYDMTNRFFNKNLAGGAMLDIGVYALSCARWFLSQKPDQVVSQVKLAPTGVDEEASFLLMNPEGQMVSGMLSLHSKQPKRAMVSCENAYIEIMEYPRSTKAVITDARTGEQQTIECGDMADALWYEVRDMEDAITGKGDRMYLSYTKDVMELMTKMRRQWGMYYPEEMEICEKI